jgi:hypothetical protein
MREREGEGKERRGKANKTLPTRRRRRKGGRKRDKQRRKKNG